MAAYKISEAGAAGIKKKIDEATADPKTQIPGFVFVAVNKNGEEIVSHASGRLGVDTNEPMTLDSVFWIASCTKMIGGIACLQLVEQGKLKLDDGELAESLIPELKNLQLGEQGKLKLDDGESAESLIPELKNARILKGFDEHSRPILVEKTKKITLRQLLSHTAGFGYTFFNPEIRKFGLPIGIDEFSGRPEDLYKSPLLFEPGTKFNYGTNIDWAGLLVERASGLSLNDYCNKYIFTPLGITNISFFPSAEMKSKLVHMSARAKDGTLTSREHLLRLPLVTEPGSAAQKSILNSAGAGCFAQPKEYVKIIAALLNDGKSPTTGAQILKPETVQTMFSNQIPEFPNFGREKIQAGIPELTNEISELYPQPHDQPQGWGLTFMLTISEGATGRGRNTGWWAGLPNLFWWADREKGVGGMVASQIVPFADAQVMGLWAQVEAAVYQG